MEGVNQCICMYVCMGGEWSVVLQQQQRCAVVEYSTSTQYNETGQPNTTLLMRATVLQQCEELHLAAAVQSTTGTALIPHHAEP